MLDVASGGGRHAYYFLDRGHPVVAVDRNVAALSPRPGLQVMQADLEDGSPWPLGDRRFAAVVVVNYLYRPILPRLVAAVATGGVLLYDTFAVGNEAFGRPSNPNFLLRPDELTWAVAGQLDILDYAHGKVDDPKPAMRQRICARRN